MENNNEIKIPVKFNRETKELSLEEATTLAQKGLKFESIEKDYELLKTLAEERNLTVGEFLKSFQNQKASVGSQSNRKLDNNPEAEEFIRGLWQ